MSVAWIRVNAALLDDPEVRAFARELLPRGEGHVARAAAGGYLVALWGKMAEHQPDGCAASRDDEQLEDWAQWKGKPGQFATRLRVRFQDANGFLKDWEEYQGAALARREADRVRKVRERSGAASTQRPTAVTRTPRRLSGRNGDGNEDGTNSGQQKHTDPTPSRTLSTSPVEKPVEPQPPAAVAEVREQPVTAPAEPSSVLVRFVARFYAGSGKERRADIIRQTNAALNGAGVKYQGSVVRAVDPEHLDAVLLEVMEEPPRDPNAAIVFVLAKLRDSYLEVLSARTKAVVGEARRPSAVPPGMPGDAPVGATPIRAAIAGVMDGLEFDGDETDVSRETGAGA